jgi:hypothetical protein
MSRRSTRLQVSAALAARVIAALAVCALAGCSSVDLKTAVQITDVSSGYHDAGLNDAGLNKLVPSLTFTVRNASADTLSSVDMVVMFWQQGRDAELDEVIVKAIGGAGLEVGASTEPIVVHSGWGYTLEQPRAELFKHGMFKDMTAKIFLKRGGKIVPAGEYPIERRLLLAAPTGTSSR